MPTKKRKTFSPEFKRDAVHLLSRGDKEIAQLARELGVRRNQLYKWKAECDSRGDSAFPGSGKKPKHVGNDDAAALKAEVKRLREENEILKKAAIFFARESS
ncbi:MAG: transposase [Cellvibrionaceae bacterium]|nr:transposase [Cellvibrionaceae bacterium]MCR6650952.1 transposase [Cellvibrionaceae bacterium]